MHLPKMQSDNVSCVPSAYVEQYIGAWGKRRLHAERGVDWADLAREIVDDNAYASRLAKDSAAALNSDYPDSEPVTWRELISLPTPDGVQISLQPQLEGAEHNAPAENAD